MVATTKEVTTTADVSNFAVVTTDVNVGELVASNLGGEGISFNDLERIQIPTGGGTSWTVTDDEGNEDEIKELEGIILTTKVIRSYWREAYTGGGTPPDCSSEDNIVGSGTPGGECKICPMNKFGTKNDGQGKGKACAERRLLFMVMEGSLLPTIISIPPTSLENAKKYLIGLSTKPPFVKMHHIITKVGLVTDKSQDSIKYSKVIFTKGPVLDGPAKAKFEEYVQGIMPVLNSAASEIANESGAGDQSVGAKEFIHTSDAAA